MSEPIQIHPYFNLATDTVELRVTRMVENRREFLTSTGWEAPEQGSFIAPTFRMYPEAAQELASRLWDQGFRAEQSKQSQGAFEAQGQHLEDMRALAFAKLNVAKP